MNYLLWVSDPKSVFLGVEDATLEIKDLIESYTLGDVTVGVQTEPSRVAELEGIIDGNIDQWSEAKDLVQALIDNWEHGDITIPVNGLRELFEVANPGEETND